MSDSGFWDLSLAYLTDTGLLSVVVALIPKTTPCVMLVSLVLMVTIMIIHYLGCCLKYPQLTLGTLVPMMWGSKGWVVSVCALLVRLGLFLHPISILIDSLIICCACPLLPTLNLCLLLALCLVCSILIYCSDLSVALRWCYINGAYWVWLTGTWTKWGLS
jgi:hypothetical protein